MITKIKEKDVKSVFVACKSALKRDSSCAQFLLPYILVYVICHGSPQELSEIQEEVDAIIGKDEETTNVAILNGSILSEQKHNSVTQDLDWMAKQTIFTSFDYMKKWLRLKYENILLTMRENRARDIEAEVQKHSDYVAVQNFVGSIKHHNLALASFECRAYARALMHLEDHLRNKSESEFQRCMTKLQQVYGALDEPDYVRSFSKFCLIPNQSHKNFMF